MNTKMIHNGNLPENEIVWLNAYRSVFKYGPALSRCYIDRPAQACA
ncbi:MAG: hypothetical protein JXA22_03160 [Candidatus Thermoplasmatota archaeon]|nr:hypothetical protein [Candidatus Thermoplasmatota archaeon]